MRVAEAIEVIEVHGQREASVAQGPERQLEDAAARHDAPERRIELSMIQEVYKQRDELLALIRKTM